MLSQLRSKVDQRHRARPVAQGETVLPGMHDDGAIEA